MNTESEWIKRNITDEQRVNEVVEIYKMLGYEVKIENLKPEEFEDECNECMKETPERFKVIYTRSGGDAAGDMFYE
jgi:hypothetical protein